MSFCTLSKIWNDSHNNEKRIWGEKENTFNNLKKPQKTITFNTISSDSHNFFLIYKIFNTILCIHEQLCKSQILTQIYTGFISYFKIYKY